MAPKKKYPDPEIGDKFGEWIVIKNAGRNHTGQLLFECKCKCEKIKIINKYDLIKYQSCMCKSCSNKARMKEEHPLLMVGEVFGKFTVKTIKEGRKKYICECECGNIVDKEKYELTSGISTMCKSCAMVNYFDNKYPIEKGEQYGNWTVIERINKKGFYKCQCICGQISNVRKWKILNIQSTKCNKCTECSEECKCCEEGPIPKLYWNSIRSRTRNSDINLSLSNKEAYDIFLQQDGKCALTGVDITFSENNNKQRTASLDRINSYKSYTIDNCQWIHKLVNRSKSILNNIEFISMCQDVAKNNEKVYNNWYLTPYYKDKK